jgi:hypothetical protein
VKTLEGSGVSKKALLELEEMQKVAENQRVKLDRSKALQVAGKLEGAIKALVEKD